MKIEMRDSRHLWIVFNPQLRDAREVIIDQEKDVRICDGKQIVKVRFTKDGHFIKDVLLNDIFVQKKPCVCPYIGTEKECVINGTLCSAP